MRHKMSGRKFNRTSAHRKAMFKNMSVSLIEHEFIKTTLPKAKDLRRVIERVVTHAKNHDDVAGRRIAFARLGSRDAVQKLFAQIVPRYQQRPGGYVRVLKCGYRAGDQAPMAYIEFVDRPQQITDGD